MRFLSYLSTLLVAVSLTACGGGGGSPGVTSGSALFTTAPSSIVLPVGASRQFEIRGGTAPYSARNTDSAIAFGVIQGTLLTLGAVASGDTTVAIVDNSGVQISISVKVSAGIAFFTTVPTALTIAPSTTQTFSLGGGFRPYSASSSNATVVTTRVAGDTIAITGAALGTATVELRDAANTVVTRSITVAATPLQLSPNGSVRAFVGDVLKVAIIGGRPPYRANSGNRAATVKVVNDNELQVSLEVVGQTVVTVLDADNQSVTLSVEVIRGTPTIRLSPDVVTISENDLQSVVLTLFGSFGPIAVFSSDTTLLVPTIVGTTVTVDTGSNGSRCVAKDTAVTITAVDAVRAVGTATITIQDNPAGCGVLTASTTSVSLPALGSKAQVVIAGGSGNYVASSSNSSVVKATVSASVVELERVAAGGATITVVDAADPRRSLTISVN